MEQTVPAKHQGGPQNHPRILWQTTGNCGTAKLWELRYRKNRSKDGTMLARLLETFGNPFERTVAQSQEAKTPTGRHARPAAGSSYPNFPKEGSMV